MQTPTDILIYFAQGEPPFRCGSIAEMEAVLDRLHADRFNELASGVHDCPLQVMISFLDHEINLGLGFDESFVMIGTKPFDDWCYAASGRENDGDDKQFYGFNQDTYWPASLLVPIDTAREAVRFFVNNQQLYPRVKWEN